MWRNQDQRNESYVGNIDFELWAKRGDKDFCLTNYKELLISLQPNILLKLNLDENVVF